MFRRLMNRFVKTILAALTGVLIAASGAAAHPHVWITMKSEVVYAPDGSITGIKHAWTFDDMFSTFATQGLESKQKGVFTRQELQPLAEVNVTSLKEYDYFSFAKANGKKAEFVDPTDYYLEHKDSLLTLHFLLPFKTPVKVQSLDLEVFDPAYFIDFTFAEKEPATLVGAPAQCKLAVKGPNEAAAPNVQRLPDARANQPDTMNFGAQFASRISVRCQ